jgi:hypothetical protein
MTTFKPFTSWKIGAQKQAQLKARIEAEKIEKRGKK